MTRLYYCPFASPEPFTQRGFGSKILPQMSYRDERNIVIAFAKAALLEKELVEAIEAQGRTPRTEAGHGIEKPFRRILAALLTLICVFAVWIEYQRFREISLREQLDAQAAAAESARKEQELQIAKQQLQIAQQQIDANAQVIRDRAQSDQAARVAFTSLMLHPLFPNQPLWITATTLNSGKTLALHAERTNTVVVTTKRPQSFLSQNGWKKLGSLIPNFIYADDFKGASGLTLQEINAIRSGALHVFVYGTVKYEDVFGNPHITDYCLSSNPDSGGFSTCNTHN